MYGSHVIPLDLLQCTSFNVQMIHLVLNDALRNRLCLWFDGIINRDRKMGSSWDGGWYRPILEMMEVQIEGVAMVVAFSDGGVRCPWYGDCRRRRYHHHRLVRWHMDYCRCRCHHDVMMYHVLSIDDFLVVVVDWIV